MTPNPKIMNSVERLNYRVTVGDVASQAGLEINLAQAGLLTLAGEANGHLQVADTGELVYLFPKNFRTILRNKYWQLRVKELWQKIWKVLFYLIRISFGIVLVLSIILMVVAIAVIIIGINSKSDSNDSPSSSSSGNSQGGGGIFFVPHFWFSPDMFWVFSPNYEQNYQQRRVNNRDKNEMNFLEAIFSFLFGDGNPNPHLEERRWQEIGAVITNNNGAIVAQQVAPYLDNITKYNEEDEDYIIPVLTRFNGYPEVSPDGEIIYYFPDLQVKAQQRAKSQIAEYLKENLWKFSSAESGQKMLAIGLGALNFVLALMLGYLLTPEVTSQLGDFIIFVNSIYGLLLGYASAYLAIPLIRNFWIQRLNNKIENRNSNRQKQTNKLKSPNPKLIKKIDYAQNFANEKVITNEDLTYSTEKDLLQQEIEQSDKIDAEWQKKLNEKTK